MLRIAVIGYGYWGPNIVRNFSKVPGVTISWVCDLNPKTLTEIPKLYPTIQTTNDLSVVFSDTSVDAVVIVTPPATHFALATRAILSGKHVLVEKPMTRSISEARKLVSLAKTKKKILMVDHTFIYTPAIKKLRSIIHSGILGDIYSIDCVRTNLGLLQKDSNVIYDLAVHDFSIIDYLFRVPPIRIHAVGIRQKQLGQETVSYISVTYPNDLFVHCHVSWLSPVKIRRMIVLGTKKMLIYDDIEASEKIKIYDKGVSFTKNPKLSYQLQVGYRSGSVTIPHIDIEEGLFAMAKEFARAIRTKKAPLTDGSMGARVVQCLELATKSLRSGNKTMTVTKLS
jgi:predicted dehydrogenase